MKKSVVVTRKKKRREERERERGRAIRLVKLSYLLHSGKVHLT